MKLSDFNLNTSLSFIVLDLRRMCFGVSQVTVQGLNVDPFSGNFYRHGLSLSELYFGLHLKFNIHYRGR